MMIKKVFYLVLLLYSIEVAHGQEWYISPNMQYHQSINNQTAPQYFTLELNTESMGKGIVPITSVIKEFSLASGFKYGGIIGHKLNNIIGLEIGFNYFKSSKTIETDNVSNYYIKGTTDWDYLSFNSLPAFVIETSYNKSIFVGKVGGIFGLASLDNSIYIKDGNYRKTYKLDKKFILGYFFGFEYDYLLKTNFSFIVECGLENSFYRPKKAKLQEYAKYVIQDQPTYIREIEYVDEIRNLTVPEDKNKPEVRLKETLRMSSIYFGMGFKYIIFKK